MKKSDYIIKLCRRNGRAYAFRISAALIAILQLISPLLSCTGRERSEPADVVRALTDAEVRLPSGAFYFSEATPGSPNYLPRELLCSAYGIPPDFDGLEGAAIRLSSGGHPCEFAVFICKSSDSALDVALFCRQRLETLKRNSSYASANGSLSRDEYLKYLYDASILVSGRYAALIISSDPSLAERIFRKMT